jgi:hypothetical protein
MGRCGQDPSTDRGLPFLRLVMMKICHATWIFAIDQSPRNIHIIVMEVPVQVGSPKVLLNFCFLQTVIVVLLVQELH